MTKLCSAATEYPPTRTEHQFPDREIKTVDHLMAKARRMAQLEVVKHQLSVAPIKLIKVSKTPSMKMTPSTNIITRS